MSQLMYVSPEMGQLLMLDPWSSPRVSGLDGFTIGASS